MLTIDWKQGGLTGSLKRWVAREVRSHMSQNNTLRRCRYPLPLRLLRALIASRTFGWFIGLYFLLDLAVLVAELLVSQYVPGILPQWAASSTELKGLLKDVGSYFITAQVGVVGVVTIAVGLVTIIAQSESSTPDVQVYYHQSLAYEVVASSIALLLVLSLQLLWPLQFVAHRFGLGTAMLIFKIFLTAVHAGWLAMNLCALSHFVLQSLRFLQPSAREEIRERYTANHVVPLEMTQRLKEALYATAGPTLIGEISSIDPPIFGHEMGDTYVAELEVLLARPMLLHDVRMRPLGWAVRRWAIRSSVRHAQEADGGVMGDMSPRPQLTFTPTLSRPVKGSVAWCRRSGGLPLSNLEKAVIRHSFVFRKAPK